MQTPNLDAPRFAFRARGVANSGGSGWKALLLAAVWIITAGAARSQDTNYWTQQYGTRAELLGGAVVGSFLDLSATYYNPGALVMSENPDVLLSANAFEYVSATLNRPAAQVEDPSATSFGSAPTLFAGLLPDSWVPGRLAYSALTRQAYNIRILAKDIGASDVLPAPGLEEYSSEYVFDQRLGENWFGLTWSTLLKDKRVGVGVTTYGIYRGQRTRVESISAVSNNADAASLIYVDEFDYSSYRLLWKFGIAYDADPVTLGFALTTPSIHAFGWGSVQYTRSAVGVDVTGDGTADNFFATDHQKDLDASYKSPLALAAGGSYRRGAASFHISAEWFDGVDRYDVVESSRVSESFPTTLIARRVSQELASVFNFGVGIEYKFKRELTVYGAFTTDRSAAVPGTQTRHSASSWDIYHISTGSAIRIAGLDLTLGIRYSFGSEALGGSYESIPSIGGSVLAGTTIDYRAWKGIIGFAFSI